MMTVKKLYEELKVLMEEGLEDCQLYGVRSPLLLKENGEMRELNGKYIDISYDENW